MTTVDMAVYDKKGNLALIVQVKNNIGTNTEWATRLRRSWVTNEFLPDSPFFLLAMPDRFYLWVGRHLPENTPPTYEADAAPLLNPYFEKANVLPEKISQTGFELLMMAWVNKITYASEEPDLLNPSEHWVFESGLAEAVRLGKMVIEANL